MKTFPFWLAIGLAVLCHAPAVSAEQDGVARFGRPLRLDIRGTQAFQAEEVRKRLLGDIDISNACYPTTSVEELCELITSKAREGYLHAGFADVDVQTAPSDDGEQLEMTVVEGERYVAGEVVVRGTNALDKEALIQDLVTDPSPGAPAWKRPHTLWRMGKPAWLNSQAAGWFREEIENRLLEHGRIGAHFTVDTVPDREHRVASLVITFTDEGKDAVLNEISITGNKKNSQEDVFAYLGLQTGMVCHGDLEVDVWRKLWESGRFIKSHVKLSKPSAADDSLKLAITLQEYEKATPLKQELSREEAALVKFACWLDRFGKNEEEVAISFDDDGDVIQFVAAPKQGYIVAMRPAGDKKSSAPFALAFVMCDGRIGVYAPPAKRKLEGIPTPGRVRSNFSMTIHDGPPKLTGYGRLTFGLGLNTTSKDHGLCEVRFDDTPVSLLSLAHEYDSKLSWDGDVLKVAFRERKLSLDATTGRLVEFQVRDDGSSTTIKRAEGDFQRLLKEIDAVAADFEPGDGKEGPLSDALTLYCDSALAFLTKKEDAEDRKQASLIRKMSKLGIAEPLDRLVVAACNAPSTEFWIQQEYSGAWAWNQGTINVLAMKHFFGSLGAEYSDLLASPGTWPWDTWREAMFALAGESQHLERELVNHLSDPNSGAVRHLIVGQLLRANDMPAMARVFGLAGQFHLSDGDFRHDYSSLLNGNTFLGHCLLTWADVVRQLDEAEIQTLCKMLVEGEWLDRGDAQIFADLARRLRQRRELPIVGALADTLDAWWKVGLRNYVKKELQALTVEPKPTTTGGQMIAADKQWRYRWHQGRWWYYGENGAWQYWTGRTWVAYPSATAGRSRARR